MHFIQDFNDDRSSSADLGSTPSGTPEDSIPTTTTSTEALSCWQRLRLQREPWVRYFQTNKIRFILSGLFLLIQLSLLVCRLLLPFADYRRMFSIFSVFSGSISFSILWVCIPDPPPYFASKSGIPLYKHRKVGDDGNRYVQ